MVSEAHMRTHVYTNLLSCEAGEASVNNALTC
jgi:hypothetical protein